jgi:hypothetical protein
LGLGFEETSKANVKGWVLSGATEVVQARDLSATASVMEVVLEAEVNGLEKYLSSRNWNVIL